MEQNLTGAGSWLEERVYLAVTEWRRMATIGGAFGALMLVVLVGGWVLWKAQNDKLPLTQIQVPGGHFWAAELHDAQGTYWSSAHGPTDLQVVWVNEAAEAFTSGPVVDKNGILYLNGDGKRVYSISPDGVRRGFVELDENLVGWPALMPDGSIVVVDQVGNLTVFTGEGKILWKYLSDPPDAGLSSPVVDSKGTVYYALRNFLVAVDAQGERVWQILLPTYSYTSPLPRLSPQEDLLFFEDTVVETATGATVFKESTEPMDKYFIGADGKIYFRTTDNFMEWQPTEKGAVMIPQVKIDTHLPGASHRFPFDTGIGPGGQAWLLYSGGFEYSRIVWLAQKGQQQQITDFPYRPGMMIGIDAEGTAYMCGAAGERNALECRAVNLASGSVKWKVDLETKSAAAGGAIVEGRLYVATRDGKIFALGR